ncbi:MAG TPA: SAM-dependent DNA methyltransferase [Caldilineae bacterium]|nr:SAM-dependent DNA methyltransferase [Caldilineae bacterium]
MTATSHKKRGGKTRKTDKQAANHDLETKLWAAADKLRGHMDASDYKNVVLGLIFLKYISDAFEERYEQLRLWTSDEENEEWYLAEPAVRYSVLEDRDEYTAENIFWVPQEARWRHLQANAKQPDIGQIVDDAMVAVEKANPSLKGVLPKDYARPTLNKQRLGELIDLIGTIGLGDAESRSKDMLGRVYEYFLGRFAEAEGKRGGQFYTPQPVVKLLVAMLEPYKGRIYDPCCGSGGMFVSSEKWTCSPWPGCPNPTSRFSPPNSWRKCGRCRRKTWRWNYCAACSKTRSAPAAVAISSSPAPSRPCCRRPSPATTSRASPPPISSRNSSRWPRRYGKRNSEAKTWG